MKIAVIGAGISGLTAACRLNGEHEIIVLEAGEHIGGHAQTVNVETDEGRHSLDVGFMVFNDWTYPNFIALLEELNVASRPTSMSFSVSDQRSGLEYNGRSFDSLFAQRRNLLRPGFYRMLAGILKFNRQARHLVSERDFETTVAEFLRRHGYCREFAEHYLLPMGSAIWSCPTGTFTQFPIGFIAEFYHQHGLLNLMRRPVWRTIAGGSRNYVRAMTAGFWERIRLKKRVERVRRFPDRVEVHVRGESPEIFDHVIFACHSDQALEILADGATATERAALSAFRYESNAAVLHTDESLLPRARKARACWNYRLGESATAAASVTYHLNMLQGIRSRHVFCLTLNGEACIDPQRILRRFSFSHPVFTAERAAAQARHADLLAANRTSFCGAYWRNGFHEDGVVSALAVVEALRSPRRNLSAPAPDRAASQAGVSV